MDSRAQHECVARAQPQGRGRVFIYSTHLFCPHLSVCWVQGEDRQVHLPPGFVPAQSYSTVEALRGEICSFKKKKKKWSELRAIEGHIPVLLFEIPEKIFI